MVGKMIQFLYTDKDGVESSRTVHVEREWTTKKGKDVFNGIDLMRQHNRTFDKSRVRLMIAVLGSH